MENGRKDPQTSKSKSKSKSKLKEDRLSSLPIHVLEMILSRLPIKAAMETIRISKHFRYRWRNIPDLILDFIYYDIGFINNPVTTRNMLSKINRVVTNHTGNIRKFELCVGDHIATNLATSWKLNAWFIRLVYSNIEELVLRRFPNENHIIPSSIYDFAKLKSLNLIKCTFRLPHLFKGFNHLSAMHLTDVKSTNVEIFIQLCPVLKQLSIYCNKEPLVLNSVYAPNLETLIISGKLLNLNNVRLRMMFNMVDLQVSNVSFTGESSTIETLIQFCPNLENLTIKYEDDYTPLLNEFCAPELRYIHIFGCSLNLNMNNYDKLRTLTLIHCEIKIQTKFDCLKSLTFLRFEYTSFLKKSYTMVCPVLKHLSIGHFSNTCVILKLHSPNLKSLTTYSSQPETVRPIQFVNPNGTTVITTMVNGFKTLEKESNFDYKFHENVENLHLIDLTLENLEIHRILQMHDITFERMKIFGIYCPHSFSQLIKNDAFIHILRNSPAMENLYTFCREIKNEEDHGYCTELFENNSLGVKFDKLKILSMDNASATKTEEMFIGYVLRNAPLLEEIDIKLFIWINRRYFKSRFAKNVLALKTASGSTAKIQISEFHDPFSITTL